MSTNPQQPMGAYAPALWEVRSMEQAMEAAVTAEKGTTTQERWEKETHYLLHDIGSFLPIQPASCVLDYGCGPGRISRALVDKFDCRVVGVDSSRAMRSLAVDYVRSDRFEAWTPKELDQQVPQGFRVDFALCIWVLQHVFDAKEVIQRILRVLSPGGLLYSLNQRNRCVPTNQGWMDDGFDMRKGLCSAFSEENFHALPSHVTCDALANNSVIQVLRRPNYS